ncbi:hypothetical protein GCM10009741_73940 [Kribbella lupini]|uniref:Uncharacterized protein n=2 Tax=Kribbella lupini TaxID=291602 RepID=A0ABN2CHZ7_9ACTN
MGRARRIEGTVSYVECVVPCMAGAAGRSADRVAVPEYAGCCLAAGCGDEQRARRTFRFGSLATTGQYRVVVAPAAAERYGYHVAFGGVRTPVVAR